MQTRDVRGQKMPKNANVICESSLMVIIFFSIWLLTYLSFISINTLSKFCSRINKSKNKKFCSFHFFEVAKLTEFKNSFNLKVEWLKLFLCYSLIASNEKSGRWLMRWFEVKMALFCVHSIYLYILQWPL